MGRVGEETGDGWQLCDLGESLDGGIGVQELAVVVDDPERAVGRLRDAVGLLKGSWRKIFDGRMRF